MPGPDMAARASTPSRVPDGRRSRVHGYTSGVFDLFHIGHLNLLSAAAAQCDYLTVAVATNALATELKGWPPVIPFLERLEIVQSMRMVDDVVVQESLDKIAAWQDLRFDMVFIGDNWKGHPRWVRTEQDLAAVGVGTVYLPFTRTSSSEALQRAHLAETEEGTA